MLLVRVCVISAFNYIVKINLLFSITIYAMVFRLFNLFNLLRLPDFFNISNEISLYLLYDSTSDLRINCNQEIKMISITQACKYHL